ncbi:restriction endonuclease subunit M, partial [Infirmifilum sp.]|uniref:restriction endonuclease subunit M n=1 Tax=Infirmifilum sp. TaxID=2856575 RepID=UPI003D115D80
PIRSEAQVEDRIRDVLAKFLNQRFNGITITAVERQYDVGGNRRADIAVLKDDGRPLLIIETKRKIERHGGWRVERNFIVSSPEVVGQAMAYAALLRKKGIHVPFIATANDRQIAVFLVPEDLENFVDWEAVRKRDYGRVIRNFYDYRHNYMLLHEVHSFSEQYFRDLLDKLTGIYAKPDSLKEKRQPLHWILIEDLRGFVDLLTPYVLEAIAPNGRYRVEIAEMVEDYARRRGYSPAPGNLAREMAYVLLNKIVFYKILERFYGLPKLQPLYREGEVRTVSEYLTRLRALFAQAVKVTEDYRAIFDTGLYDAIDIVESENILEALDYIIGLMDYYEVEKFGDIIGYVYEDLIPGEERHQLGQFYTPRPIAELIVKWAIRSPDDKILDPGCGSGTFLVEAYKRLAELKLKRSYGEIEYVRSDVHRQILGQLYGIDINEFPAHLTAINLAMRNPRAPSDNINIFVKDYFTVIPGQKLLAPYRVATPEGRKQLEVEFKDFDAVVGNPPYTRWTEIINDTQDTILRLYRRILTKYNLTPQVQRGVEPGIYVYWIIHSTGFLKEGG